MAVAKILIHSQGNSEGALREAIDHYRPAMVFLISNPDTNAVRMKTWIEEGNPSVGKWSREVEHCEIINIEPFSENSVLQMVLAVQEAKRKAELLSNGRTLEFYAGVSGGTKLMVIGMALAAIQGNLTAYYVDKPAVSERAAGDYLFEITFMNRLMNSINWINSDKRHLENLKYLQVLQNREDAGLESTSPKMDRTKLDVEPSEHEKRMTIMRVDRSITRQLNLLESKGWVSFEGNNPKVWSLEPLGLFILSVYGEQGDDSDST